jgi:ParB-like chromosome segregation protein Spo0J
VLPPPGTGSIERVPLTDLVVAGSPRLSGDSAEHARELAGSGADLPPILVHRATRWVVDGRHRVRAARLRGAEDIAARYFDGDQSDAFVQAVQANLTGGLPLTLADRTAAAARIIETHAHWSDRAIATTTGLSHKTVAAIRRRASGDSQSSARVGRDGRVRPLSTAAGRRAAGMLIAEKPDVSLREIARSTGLSIGTARDVRARVRRGEDPVLPQQRARATAPAPRQPVEPPAPPTPLPDPPTGDLAAVLCQLRRDPSLRFTEGGRLLLRLLDTHTLDPAAWVRLIGIVPPHWNHVIATIARGHADAWRGFADRLEATPATRRAVSPAGHGG